MLRSFLRSPTGVASLVGVGLFILLAVFAPVFLQERATERSIVDALQGPSWEHWLGTDGLGRDRFARMLVATRPSLLMALAAVAIAAGLGIPLGAVAVQLRPRFRTIILRGVDMMIAFPGLILAIYVGTIVGPGVLGPVLGVGLALSFNYARLSSTIAMSITGRDYVHAARLTGVRGTRLLATYVLPNASEPLIVATTVSITTSIVVLSGLSFLGLGIQPPDFDWGTLLTAGLDDIYVSPAAATGPALMILLSALTFGFFGEALARASNPLLATGAGRKKRKQEPSTAGDAAPSGATVDARTGLVVDDALAERLALPADVAVPPIAAPVSPNGNGGSHEEHLVEVRDLRVVLPTPDGPIELLCGVSFDVDHGERVGVVGESGSGKTLTALAVAQLVPFPLQVQGTIAVDGEVLTELSPGRLDHFLSDRMAMIFQDPMSALNPAMRIGTQLTEAVEEHRDVSHEQAVRMAVDRLGEVRIATPTKQLRRYPHEFSGGMRQRVLIAMGLMNEPKLLIADEPTTALDVTIQAQIMDLLEDVDRKHGMGLLFISHDLALVRQNTDRIVVMYAGYVVEEIPSARLEDSRHPYTRALLAAVPDLASSRDEPLLDIPGRMPDAVLRPPGCPFHPRCPLATDICTVEMPRFRALGNDEGVACWDVEERLGLVDRGEKIHGEMTT